MSIRGMNINFHVLRHTFATVFIKYGVDTKVLSEMLGHSNIATTLNLYVHPTLDQKVAEKYSQFGCEADPFITRQLLEYQARNSGKVNLKNHTENI